MRPIVTMDFVADLDLVVTDRLKQWGYRARASDDAAHRYWMLLSLTERAILPIPSEVHFSSEIRQNPKLATYAHVVEEITMGLARGQSMRPYLSTQAVRPRPNKRHLPPDPLLSHWGIHHLHLSSIETVNAAGFVKRADDLLFLRQDGPNVYLIDIRPHSEELWHSNPRLLKIIDSNWRHLLPAHAHVTGHDLAAPEIANFRKKNLNVALNINGRAVMPGGVLSDGTSMLDFMHYRVARDSLAQLEGHIRDNLWVYFPRCAQYAAEGVRRIFEVRLLDIRETFVLGETTTGDVANVPKPYGF